MKGTLENVGFSVLLCVNWMLKPKALEHLCELVADVQLHFLAEKLCEDMPTQLYSWS